MWLFSASFKSCLGLVATKLASILATSQRSLSSLADRCRVSNLGVSAINRCILCGQHSLASFSVCPLVFIQYYFCFFFGFFCYLHAARFYEYLWCALRSPEPNAKCAFWVKLYHKPRAACKAKWKVKNGRKYNNNNLQFYICMYIYVYIYLAVPKPKTKAKWSRRETRVTAIMQIYDQNSIMCLLERSCCAHASSGSSLSPFPSVTPPANVCGSPYLAAGTCWASCWAGRQLMLRSLTLKAKMLWFTHTHTHTQIQLWRNCICGAWHAFYVPLRAARGVALASLNQLTNKYLAASCHSKGRGGGDRKGVGGM